MSTASNTASNIASNTAYDKEVKQHQKWGYEVVEVYSDDESDEVVKYQWETYDRKGNVFTTEDEAWSDAFEDCSLVSNES